MYRKVYEITFLKFTIKLKNFLLFILLSGFVIAQSNLMIDAQLEPNFFEKSITGKLVYSFDCLQKVDSIYLDAKQMIIRNLTLNGKKIDFNYIQNKIVIKNQFKRKNNRLEFNYFAKPSQSLYFLEYFKQKQIWTQGQGKETSYWLPSIDDVNKKILFHISILYHQDYQVISNGLLLGKKTIGDQFLWQYKMNYPMSSYLVMMAIGQYQKLEAKAASNTILEFYLTPNQSDRFKYTYNYSQKMFDFLEQKIGVPYPWQIYRQIPVYDFLYSGMENTTSTIFSNEFVVDQIGYNDITYHNVNAHELTHQWFGNLVTAKTKKDHWLQEGFATYYAYLAEKNLFGEDYYLEKIYEIANNILAVSNDDELLLYAENQSSMTYYYKGAWMLIDLEHTLGTCMFDNVVKTFLNKIKFESVTTQDFFTLAQTISQQDLSEFQTIWLNQSGLPRNRVLNVLGSYKKFGEWMELLSLYDIPYQEKKVFLEKLWTLNDQWMQFEILKQVLNANPLDDQKMWVKKALTSVHHQVNQFALMLNKSLYPELKSNYEFFLHHQSYVNTELALQLLWQTYPEERTIFLEKTKHIIGLNDFNVRITWLSLALLTETISSVEKLKYYDELLGYTSSEFPSNIRRNALNKMKFLDNNDTNLLKALANGIVHHKWQFAKFCRDEIKNQIKANVKKEFYQKLLNELNGEHQKILKNLLE